VVFGVTRAISAKFPESPQIPRGEAEWYLEVMREILIISNEGDRCCLSRPKYHEAKPSGILGDESSICSPSLISAKYYEFLKYPSAFLYLYHDLWYFKGINKERGHSFPNKYEQ